MNLKQALGRTQDQHDQDLNITPVMNIFLILIPFLLLTAVFVKIAVLEFSLPSSEKQAGESKAPPQNSVVTILAIKEQGFELKTQGMKFSLIVKKQQEFDYQSLVEKLQAVKQRHQNTEDIIIAPQAMIKYDTIIKVMDRCRENGFTNISISG